MNRTVLLRLGDLSRQALCRLGRLADGIAAKAFATDVLDPVDQVSRACMRRSSRILN